ncbi:MAG: hypothetical protein ACREFZ_00155 [Acetobacteraceae bacterium]
MRRISARGTSSVTLRELREKRGEREGRDRSLDRLGGPARPSADPNRGPARAARPHTAALAGNDKIYQDVLRQCGVVRALGLRDMLEYAR